VVEGVGRAELWVAFVACVLVFAATVVHVVRTVLASTTSRPPITREARLKG